MPSDAEQLLAKEVAALVRRLRLWTPARWAAAAEPWGTRADLGRHLAQWLADECARWEGLPKQAVCGQQREVPVLHRELPVLHPDLLVADQLAVTGDDLVRAAPPDAACRDAVDHLLAHRLDLLDEDPPTSLGGAEALARGRTVCTR